MISIEVKASKHYNVYIGTGILPELGRLLRSVCKGTKVAVISDTNVFPLYGDTVMKNLIQAGFEAVSFTFPAGEASKNPSEYFEILNFLADQHITRSDCLVALGGGVVGDLTGFAAATYLRGVSFIQVPTTLLAAVDSSVGGKTAIDLPAGKNLVGAFWQPDLVLCDTETLDTLPADIFRDGCAEVIKYGVLYDPDLFEQLQQDGLHFKRDAVIARCVELKKNVVIEDEYDTGARMKLNLGHTIGHGVEAQSHFTISHGAAVAIGMSLVAKAAAQYGYCSRDCCDRILDVISHFGLSTTTLYTARQLYESALTDKKRNGEYVNLILPQNIGNCAIVPMKIQEFQSFIEAGLSYGNYH